MDSVRVSNTQRILVPRLVAASLALSGAIVFIAVVAVAGWLFPSAFGPLATLLIDRHAPVFPLTVQNLMWLAFAAGLAELWVRYSTARREEEFLARRLLPEDDAVVLRARDLGPIYSAVRRAGGPAGGFLPTLIHRIVLQFQSTRSVEQANALLNSSLDLYGQEIDLRYAFLRYLSWLIPTLGFIGTVVGITAALAFAGTTPSDDPNLLPEVIRRLGLAFNTTLLALILAAILVFLIQMVQAAEEHALNRSGQYCLDHLVNRLYVSDHERHDGGSRSA